MLTRTIEPEYVPMLKEKRLGLMIYNPLAGGLLTGRHLPGHEEADSRFTQPAFKAYPQRYLNEENFNAVAKLMQIAQQAGISLAEMAMRWCISQEVVDSLIMGFSKMQQLQDNLQYLQKGALTNDVLQACDEVYHSLAGTRFAYFR